MSDQSESTAGEVRLRVPDRNQVVMTVQCPNDLIGPDHPARVVWGVVGKLDLSAFHESIKAREGNVGRDATDPALLIALWLYAAIRGVGSARELARLCQESRPYQWLCGGLSVNHHTLSDFRVGRGAELDDLFTRVIATLVDKELVKVHRVSQDGIRIRACAGAGSFRREERLKQLLEEAKAHVQELRSLLDDPERSAGLSARRKAARTRAARERVQRLEQAVGQLPKLQKKQEKLARKVSKKDKQAGKLKEPRVSTTDPEARVMKMGDGGFRPAMNVQFAVDTESRAIVGVDVVGEGVDTGLLEPMREQVEQRTGQKVAEHLADGGFLKLEDVERATEQGVALFIPPKPPRNKQRRGSEYEPRPQDSRAIKDWRQRMGSEQGKHIYKERASTVETVNADLKTRRGLLQLTVRGLRKAKCIALWSALAYNLMHFGVALLR